MHIQNQQRVLFLFLAVVLFLGESCKKGVQQQKDELYSRHLQRHVKLDIIHTPAPEDKQILNLLIVNNAQTAAAINLAAITDSLYKAGAIQPLVIVAVDGTKAADEYGIADNIKKGKAGAKADHYDAFVHNELYPYTKQKAGVRKFNSFVMAGFNNGGISAMDIAWAHPDKISKVGVFSGIFADKNNGNDSSYNGAMFEKLKASRKRPALQYWFYTGVNPTDTSNDTRPIVDLLKAKTFVGATDVQLEIGATNDTNGWKKVMPDFLKWAFGK